MEACWQQNQRKIDTNCEKRFFDKSCSRCSGGLILEGPRVEVGSKNRSKIEAQDGLPLGIDFWWILVGLGRRVGVENRTKSEKKSIEKHIEKMMKKRCVLEASWRRLGRVLGANIARSWLPKSKENR